MRKIPHIEKTTELKEDYTSRLRKIMTDESKTTKEKHIHDKNIAINVQILIISDSISVVDPKSREKLDLSSKIASELITQQGYHVKSVEYVPDEKDQIQPAVKKFINQKLELILTIGGTGITKRDVTIESIHPLLDKELPGFGELFRSLTYAEVGTVSIVTRAMAGVAQDSVIVCLPGSPNAQKVGVPLILKEIIHLINMIRK
jgi:molybdopterin adenylyltransferase